MDLRFMDTEVWEDFIQTSALEKQTLNCSMITNCDNYAIKEENIICLDVG